MVRVQAICHPGTTPVQILILNDDEGSASVAVNYEGRNIDHVVLAPNELKRISIKIDAQPLHKGPK